jgi:ATP-dependent helicase/nuclease subunit A
MSRAPRHASLQAALADTTRRQRDASHPQTSAWVSANAGTGKTHVLTSRVLRILLDGAKPQRILCLTFTKAAAAEMSERVFTTLASWATTSAEDLRQKLAELKGEAPSEAELARGRVLFAHAIETPGGLKVQTIHAFCERLLQRFPLEAGVAPGFSILDDAKAHALRAEAIDATLLAATGNRGSALGQALATITAYAADDRFDSLVAEALSSRAWIEQAVRLVTSHNADPIDEAEQLYRRHFGVRRDVTPDKIEQALCGVASDAQLQRAIEVLGASKGKTDQSLAADLAAARLATGTGARIEALRSALLTKDGEPRSDARFVTKAIRETEPGIHAALVTARDVFAKLWRERTALAIVTATVALLRLAEAVMQRYKEAKARRAALDFDDLIARTESLLAAKGSADWVLYKLDGGLSHILVDESQDTSPSQWNVVSALVAEFFSDESRTQEIRTLFAVGDEKQSIYSFQGAAPHLFRKMGDTFRKEAARIGHTWRDVPLTLSFRTVQPVLEAVDAVFASPDRTPGVGQDIVHEAKRIGHAGIVEIWDTERPADAEPAPAFAPLDEESAESPVTALAERIAATVKGWIDTHEPLPSQGRPIGPGDVLILLSRRRPFAPAMIAALKARGIPVAGADRIRLTEQIAVQDLVALGDFLTLPEDDLSLAAVLKSPLFGLDDDDLIALAPPRKGTLWKALLDASVTNARYREPADLLKRWRKAADFDPPFEFYANVLDRDGMRKKLIARLGPEAADGIDELLSLAIKFDEGSPPSLPGFLADLRAEEREIKRDMQLSRNEVRVMTVHGAKGLEAPIVFLPDTCSTRSGRQPGGLLPLPDMPRPYTSAVPFAWPLKGSSSAEAIAGAKATRDAAEREERNRLLYVAMTRARDRLYVAGFEGKTPRSPDCWYDLMAAALKPLLVETADAGARAIWRVETEQTAAPEKPKHDAAALASAVPLPPWAMTHVPREPQLAVPLAPSRLAPYDIDAEGEPVAHAPEVRAAAKRIDEPPAASPVAREPAAAAAPPEPNRFLRGTLTHALLEHLPQLDKALWPDAAASFIATRGATLSPRTRDSIVSESLRILTSGAFASLFGPNGRAEVPIIAELPRPEGKRGPPLKLTGQIDRLVVTADEVLIVDYKTNRPPPLAVADVAEVYLFQLAAYRLALQRIYPGHTVRAALLWTELPDIMEIPQEILDTYASRLWEIETGRLDG